MPPDQRDAALLWDMVTAAKAVLSFTRGKSFVDYQNDLMLRSAVERQVEIIGEAARGVSDAFKTAHPEIAWRGIVAQRHVLAHDYGAIQHDKIWRVVETHIPELIKIVEPLIPPPPSVP